MTVAELAQRLAFYTPRRALTGADLSTRQAIADAINAGVFEYLSIAPEYLRRTAVSHPVRAPETIEIAVTNGSQAVATDSFQNDMIGCAIDITGDDTLNEVSSRESLFRAYEGATGTVAATVYFDVIPFIDSRVVRLVSDPIIVGPSGGRLMRDELSLRATGKDVPSYLPWVPASWWFVQSNNWTRRTGIPTRYCLEPGGVSSNDETGFKVRLDPMPERAMNIQFDIIYDAVNIAFTDLETTMRVPVPGQHVVPLVMPLCIAQLASTPFWSENALGEKGGREMAMAAADAARAKISRFIEKDIGVPNNRVRTRRGY
jgi:hypothetical protein